MSADKKINILIYGISGICCSLIRNFQKSKNIGNIYIANGKQNKLLKNITYLGDTRNIKFGEHKKFIKENNIDFVIIFSETLLYKGFVNFYKNEVKIPIIGTTPKWFLIECNKVYGKKFMTENNIKIPKYKVIKTEEEIKNIDEFGLPIVIKSNYLKGGYGSYIYNNKEEAKKKAKSIFKNEKQVILEEYIKGTELTQQYIWDGNNLVPLLSVRDYKPLCEGNKGINTGGMGSYTPVALTSNQRKMLDEYNQHMSDIFQNLKPDFKGIFASNIIFTDNDIYTFELNMRPGITEFENLIEHMDCDILELFYNIAHGQVSKTKIKYKNGYTGCVVLQYKNIEKRKNKIIRISNPEKLIPTHIPKDIKINYNFYSYKKSSLYVGFRIYNLITTNKEKSFKNIYNFLERLKFRNIYYRKDIGIDYKH